MNLFDDWASNLCPSTDYDDIFLKIEKLANSVIVKSAIEETQFKLSQPIVKEDVNMDVELFDEI